MPIKREPKPKGVVISASALAEARRKRVVANVDPFKLPEFPPAVMQAVKAAGKGMAMDQSPITGYNTWAGGGFFGGMYAEGMEFMGYPQLAFMAQRAEYRRPVETLARHATRDWFRFQSAADDDDKSEKIKKIEEEMTRLDVQAAFSKASKLDGFYGRGHIFLDFGDEDKDELLKPIGDGRNDISKGKVSKEKPLRRIQTVEPVWCYPMQYNAIDPLQPDWYKPQTWVVMARQIHSSRLLPFVSHEVSDLLKPAYSFGGLSMTQQLKPTVDNWLRTRQGVSDIVNSFSVMVLATDMGTLTQPGGTQILDRIDFFNAVRDNRGTFAVDKTKEDFKNVAAPITGLDKLQAQAQEHQSAVTGMPLIFAFGIVPAGLNATSEGEIRVWYDYVRSYQETFFRPNLTRIIDFVQLSLFGEVDPDITFEFEPLWSLSEKEEAETRKIEAETDALNIEMGSIAPEEVRKRIANDPDTPYAGLKVDDLPGMSDLAEGDPAETPDPNAEGDPEESLAEQPEVRKKLGQKLLLKSV